MEDAHVIQIPFCGDPNAGFFAIYDGHGGREAADIASSELHKFLAAELLSGKNSSVEQCFVKAYESMDLRLKFDAVYMGATAVTCLIRAEAGRPKLYAANAGDARAVLCRGGKAVRLTYDHKASDAAEQARVQECGGFVSMNRVQGVLAVSRSLGDHAMKQSVISKPHFWEDELTEEDTFAIVACDGLWDVCSDQVGVHLMAAKLNLAFHTIQPPQEAVELVQGETDAQAMAQVCLLFIFASRSRRCRFGG